MAENKILTIGEVADWIPPSEAVEILKTAYGDLGLAKGTLLERLLGGMVRSIAQETVIEGSRPHRTVNVQIPAGHWKDISTLDAVWKTGDLYYKFLDDYSAYRSVAVGRHFNVRFDPIAVRAIIAPLLKPASRTSEDVSGTEPASKGPRVSDAHLNAWYEFYKATHAPSDDTEDRAVEFARHCFLGKSVSGDRIRALRGSVKRGPKPKGT
jgi:hypothetical protein